MLVLFETPAGYAVFKLLKEKKLSAVEDLYKDFETADKASKMVKLKHFKKFEDTTEALAAATASIEGKMSKSLKTLMKTVASKEITEEMAVADAKLGNIIKDKFDISCVCSTAINELMRGIRAHMNSLITGLTEKETTAMSLGLAHSLSRYKLKFSPDKVDTMIVQAISLLDDLDKELNNYVMRCREWYGWHFPELGKIVTDNIAYAKTVKMIGFKSKTGEIDLSSILPEEVEEEVKAAAEISMGTDISDEDIENVTYLCEQIIQIAEYRMSLYDYLKNRMQAIAPNLTILVGELVGARLIAHAGSLLNLAKQPASTVQILGAEKALFRALKTKHDTPKYGLIYHASLVGQTSAKTKGKISRMLAAKTALAVRYDALGEEITTDMGIENRAKLESRIRFFEEGGMTQISGTGKGKSTPKKHSFKSEEDIPKYDNGLDSTIGKKRKVKKEDSSDSENEKKTKKSAKKKKIVKKEDSSSDSEEEKKPVKTSAKKKIIKKEDSSSDSEEEEKKPVKTPAKKTPAKQKIKKEESSSDSSSDEEEKKKTVKSATKKKIVKKAESSSDSSSDEEEKKAVKTPAKKTPAKKKIVKKEDSSSDSEEEKKPVKTPAKKTPAKQKIKKAKSSSDSSSDEEEKKKKVKSATKKKIAKKAESSSDSSSDEEEEKKAVKSAKKKRKVEEKEDNKEKTKKKKKKKESSSDSDSD